jgi:hypothetical protein
MIYGGGGSSGGASASSGGHRSRSECSDQAGLLRVGPKAAHQAVCHHDPGWG